jgi:hypothetical protein
VFFALAFLVLITIVAIHFQRRPNLMRRIDEFKVREHGALAVDTSGLEKALLSACSFASTCPSYSDEIGI